jgi:hypothetical protein
MSPVIAPLPAALPDPPPITEADDKSKKTGVCAPIDEVSTTEKKKKSKKRKHASAEEEVKSTILISCRITV